MPVVDTTQSFATGDTVTSTTLNNIMDQSIFVAGAVVSGSGLAITAGGQMTISDNSLPGGKITNGTITSAKIENGTIVNDDINASAAIDLSKLATGVLPTAITIASANIVDGTIVADDIANATITAPKLNGAQSGSAPIYGVRAWVKLNPYVGSSKTAAYKNGNYTRTASETTVSITSHGLKANDKIRLDFTSGTATDGLYTVSSVTDANTFVVNHTGTATSGAVTAQFVQIQAQGNISSASWYDASSTRIVVNFATAMPNVNYASVVTSQHYPSAWFDVGAEDTLGTTQLNTVYQAHIAAANDSRFLNAIFIG